VYAYKIIRGVVALLWLLSCLNATEYFVSEYGDDESDGSINSPFLTIQRAVDEMSSGDICQLRDGRHYGFINMENKSNLSFKSYPGEEGVIDGTKLITSDWVQYQGSIYKTTVTDTIWQLFVNDRMMQMARWPNLANPTNPDYSSGGHPNPNFPEPGSFWDINSWAHCTDESIFVQGVGGNIVNNESVHSLASLNVDLTGGLAVGKLTTSEHIIVEEITNHIPGSSSFECTAEYLDVSRDSDGSESRYWFEGKLDLLDSPGEWFFDQSTMELYLWCEDNANPSLHDIRGRTIDRIMELHNSSNILFENLTFYAGNFLILQGDHRTFNHCNFSYPSYSKRMLGVREQPLNIDLDGGQDDTFYDCVFEYSENCAITFHSAGTRRWRIENSLFHHILWAQGRQGAVYGRKSEDDIFRRNTIHTIGKGNGLKGGKADLIELNNIYNIHYSIDGSNIQIAPGQQPGMIIGYNWCYDTNSHNVIRFDGDPGAYDGTIHHCISMNGNRGLRVKGTAHFIYNNTAFGCVPRNDIQISIDKGGNDSTYTMNNAATKLSGSNNGFTAIPGFHDHNWNGYETGTDLREELRDPYNFDFRPKAGSELIDAGVIIPGITEGYVGEAPDIGAYEFGDDNYWIPGRLVSKASTPVPPHDAVNVMTDADLMWLKGLEATSFQVYFGTESGQLTEMGTQVNNIYDPGSLIPGQLYYWRVNCNTPAGWVTGDEWNFLVGSAASGLNNDRESPFKFHLSDNYPNPFNAQTTIKFTLPYASQVKMQLFNLLGGLELTLVDRSMVKGHHSVDFQADLLASGVYLYRLSGKGFSQTKKLVLIK
jgi:hypothetical protein